MLHPNINIDQEVNGDTPLVAAIKHNHPSIVTTLLLYGADPNVPTSYGTMPLMMACEIGNKEIVQSLLQHNANVDYQDERTGDTPLTVATEQKHNEIVQLLVEWRAGVDTEDMHMPQKIVADAEHLQPVPPSTDSQSSQSSLEGHCNSSAGNYSNISTSTATRPVKAYKSLIEAITPPLSPFLAYDDIHPTIPHRTSDTHSIGHGSGGSGCSIRSFVSVSSMIF